jgi:hypothetical protein
MSECAVYLQTTACVLFALTRDFSDFKKNCCIIWPKEL